MIISIDGPAGSGKSTVADALAKKLGFAHFNSGSLYRGITACFIAHNWDVEKDMDKLSTIQLETHFENDLQHVVVNGQDYTAHLRDNVVSELTPIISKYATTRQTVDACQKRFALNHDVVIDGRDIGSFVFPNADFKFYLDCDVHVRAQRRFLEEQAKGSNITLAEIEAQLEARDKFDKTKKLAPLVVPKGAIMVNSTNRTVDEIVDEMFAKIKK